MSDETYVDEELEGEIDDEGGMSEEECESYVYEALLESGEFRKVHTFEEVGMMTYNKGVVVVTDDDDEFQLTIVRRR